MNIAATPGTEPHVARAFGVEAERRLATLGIVNFDLVVTDWTKCAEALAEVVGLKMGGKRVVGGIILPEPRVVVARLLGSAVVAQVQEDDRRRALFDEIAEGTIKDANGVLFSQMRMYSEPVIHTLVALIRLVDGLLVGSWTEYERVSQLLSYRHANPMIVAGFDRDVPTVLRKPEPGVVVWGPKKTANELALFSYALADLHVPYSVICRDASDAILPGRYLNASEAATVLTKATVVVDTETTSPATTIALSALGVSLAAESTTGAHEHVGDIHQYSGHDRKSILEAVRVALGAPTARPRRAASIDWQELSPRPLLEEPLVTIVLVTRDRRAYFEQALKSLLNQTHRNLEVLIWNGGASVDDLIQDSRVSDGLAGLPHAELRAKGYWQIVAGRASGKYLGILYDDDLLFPDHIGTLVAALERSGAGAAWADLLVRYLQPVGDAETSVVGYGLWNNFHQPFDKVSLLGQCTLGNMVPCLMRRQLFIDLGAFDSSFRLFGDWDLCIRLAHAAEFVYVDRVTSQYSRFLDSTNLGTQHWSGALDDTRRIFEKHPSTDRFTVAVKRNAVLQAHSTSSRPPNLPPISFVSATIQLDR